MNLKKFIRKQIVEEILQLNEGLSEWNRFQIIVASFVAGENGNIGEKTKDILINTDFPIIFSDIMNSKNLTPDPSNISLAKNVANEVGMGMA